MNKSVWTATINVIEIKFNLFSKWKKNSDSESGKLDSVLLINIFFPQFTFKLSNHLLLLCRIINNYLVTDEISFSKIYLSWHTHCQLKDYFSSLIWSRLNYAIILTECSNICYFQLFFEFYNFDNVSKFCTKC